MKEKVLISIKGLHTTSEAEGGEEIEIIYPGHYRKVGDTRCFRFTEVSEDGKSENLIKLKDGSLELIKNGQIRTNMLFECGKKTFTEYMTPFGMIELGINAAKISITESENRIEAYANYSLEADGNFLSDCRISITVEPCEDVKIASHES